MIIIVHSSPSDRTIVHVTAPAHVANETEVSRPLRDRPGGHGRPVAVAAALLAVPVLFILLVSTWTSWEAALTGRVAALVTGVEVTRYGSSLTASGDAGTLTLFVVGWCSSLGPVLATGALGCILRGPVVRRVRVVLLAVVLLVVANVVRLAALMWWGVEVDPGSVDGFHDGPATAFSVVVVLLAAAAVLLSPARTRAGTDLAPPEGDGRRRRVRP